VSAGKNRPQPPIPVMLHPDAQRELGDLDPATRADVLVIIAKVNGKKHQEIVSLLDVRTEPKIAQWERSNRAGALRVVFAWGKGVLWFIGAFVKVNNPDGERQMVRIRARADEVKGTGVSIKK